MIAYDMACKTGGNFLLRIEDIDRARSKPEWEEQIFDDLLWLGVKWDIPVLRQSENLSAYHTALESLWRLGLLYPCFCNRRDIQAAASAPQEGAPLTGPDGLIYPGTCRDLPRNTCAVLPENTVLRLDMKAATALLPDQISFEETSGGSFPQRSWQAADLNNKVGDIVVARKDMGTSYHLSVVIDDAEQQITDVVRGQDLFDATVIHVVLQILLNLPTPRYHHHILIRDEAGKRLAKRDDARAIAKYRADGATPEDIRRIVGLSRFR